MAEDDRQVFDVEMTVYCHPEEEFDITSRMLREHIKDAVSCFGGQYFPGDAENPSDPFFKYPDVKIKKATKRK